jgi:solute carrier family 36 (proton-coupled amino acid transporter)
MLHFKAVAKTKVRKAADVLLCIFGFVVMVYTTSLTMISWASGDQAPGLPSYCEKKNNTGLF